MTPESEFLAELLQKESKVVANKAICPLRYQRNGSLDTGRVKKKKAANGPILIVVKTRTLRTNTGTLFRSQKVIETS